MRIPTAPRAGRKQARRGSSAASLYARDIVALEDRIHMLAYQELAAMHIAAAAAHDLLSPPPRVSEEAASA